MVVREGSHAGPTTILQFYHGVVGCQSNRPNETTIRRFVMTVKPNGESDFTFFAREQSSGFEMKIVSKPSADQVDLPDERHRVPVDCCYGIQL